MKKSELVIGKDYYVQSSNEWQTTSWGVLRVRIIDTVHGKWRWNGNTEKYEQTTYNTGRTGIVVERINVNTGKVEGYGVATLASIRGEWEPTVREVAARRALDKSHADAVDAKNLVLREEAGKAVAMAKQMGITGVKTDVYGRTVEVHPAVMQAMLLKLDSIGWTL